MYPAILKTFKNTQWDIYGISPEDSTHLSVDMPGAMDHIETVKLIKSEIHEPDSNAHKGDSPKTCRPKRCNHSTRATVQKSIHEKKQELSRAEDFFARSKPFLGHVFATSALHQAFPPSSPSHSYSWALINVNKSRIFTKSVCFLLNRISYNTDLTF